MHLNNNSLFKGYFDYVVIFRKKNNNGFPSQSSLVGIEPTTFGLEVQRAILCATGTG